MIIVQCTNEMSEFRKPFRFRVWSFERIFFAPLLCFAPFQSAVCFSSVIVVEFVMLCAIWYHLYKFKKVKHIHGGVWSLQLNYNIKSNTPSWVFFTFLTLYRWYQIAQSITFDLVFAHGVTKNHFVQKQLT